MTTTEWFSAMARNKRKDVLTALHHARRDALKDQNTVRLLTELIMHLEQDHHAVND